MKKPTAGGLGVKRQGKNVAMFGLSLIIGAGCVFLAKSYMEDQIALYRNQFEKTEPMTKIVVPSRKLIRGETVTQDVLVTRPIPVQYADSNSVTAADFELALGQRVDFDVDEGRPLLWAHLEGGKSPTFSGKVPEGLRAMTVRVDEINSISGFLQPEDRVDLLMSHNTGGNQEIFPLIERLEVIATGVQTMVDKNGSSSTRSFSTITIQVSPDQAQRITLAQQVGKITAVLRNPEDEAPLVGAPMNVAQLLGIVPEPEPEKKPRPVKRPPPEPRVEFIVGGQ